MAQENYKYILVAAENLDGMSWDCVHQNQDTAVTLPNGQTIVSYEGAKPRCLYGMDVLTRAEVRAIAQSLAILPI